MPFVSGTSVCAICSAVLTDDEVYDGAIYSCPICAPTPYRHLSCQSAGGSTICPTCGGALAQEYLDAWGTDADVNDWVDRLARFLAAPPPPAEWEYLGYQHGGHEAAWKGESAVFGIGSVEVRLHVHFTGKYYDGNPDWRYGGAWVSGVRNAELSVDENRPLHGTLLPVVQRHWTAMLDAESAISASKLSSGSWRTP
jgi:predicted RNA-binding Zn-ribbon protein involved in translation (DUF1610 family)